MISVRFLLSLTGILIFTLPASSNYWMSGNQLTVCGEKVLDLLSHSDEEGLDPKNYNYAIEAVQAAQQGGSSGAAENALTSAMTKYISDVSFNPKRAGRETVMSTQRTNARDVVSKGMASGSCDWLSQPEPAYTEYKQLKLLYRKYAHLQSMGPWPQVDINVKLPPGDRDSNIPAVREILGRLGDLPKGRMGSRSNHYGDDLVDAVKKFQKRHALWPNGLIDSKTARELNKTPAERLRQIRVTMERWRWMPRNPGYRYIIVNVAGYHLEAFQGGRLVMSSPLIVGADYRPTPVFKTRITSVKFNPSWNVPFKLAVEDHLPKLKQNPGYMYQHDMVITQGAGGSVNPYQINWHKYSKAHFPFSIRRRPGPNNPLGKIRFTSHNPYEIYLHSNSEQYKYLFDYPRRDFSSGCIRVKNIVEFTHYVFNEPGKWTHERIIAHMQGTVTEEVKIKQPIPTYVTYCTVWTDEKGVPHFMPDVYGKDRHVGSRIQS